MTALSFLVRTRAIVPFAACALAATLSASGQTAQAPLTSKLAWRSVGPFIGGRVVAVDGVPSERNLFYMGAVDGGIWRSTDYGLLWTNVSDGTLPGDSNSIGAIAVAPSNPKIIYAGTGESDIRGDMITGDGIFKSTDAGKTWNYAGLRDTHTTSAIVIDPRDPNVVYAASMGHVFVENADRGVYKTTDGGRTWKRIFFVSAATGAISLVMDPKHPQTLYAAMWQARRQAWRLDSGGPGSGLFKSTDGGAHWASLSNNPGYPRGVLGRIGVAVAASDPRVVYSIVQAKEGGIFRSADAGKTWTRTNGDMELRQRAFYYTCVFVDPTNPNKIFVPNVQGLWTSTDGGKSFFALRPPHGDNHIVWVNPHDPKVLLEGNDGGATVSTDGGQTWSSERNQPTGQFYHVSIDNQFPFHLYGAQQDEGSISGPSAAFRGAIAESNWQPAAYGESTFVAPQPDDPNITYGSGYFSIFLQYDATTGEYRSVSPYPNYLEGASSKELKYRFGWTHPILFSPADSKELLAGSQYVLASNDYGQTWREISPDLTRNDPKTEAPTGGPIDLDQTSAEVYPDISSLAVSPSNNAVIWAGSADGLVHVTKDGGAHWSDVTPAGFPQTAAISSIEPSHANEGAAYVSVSRYMWDDFRPYVFETTDYGAHWQPIVDGLPADQFVFVVKQDPSVPNLLFAGTKSGVYMSLDGGARWQPLALNLPKVQVRDLAIDARQGDVVAATHGRAFWILDNLTLLEQLARGATVPNGAATVFAPQTAWLSHAFGSPAFPQATAGKNPPFGATVFFDIPRGYNGSPAASLTFADASGRAVRTVNLHLKKELPKQTPEQRDRFLPTERRQRAEEERTGITPGMNAFQWDLRYAPATDVTGFEPPVAAGGEDDTVDGPVVLPGRYTVTLHYGGATSQAPFDVSLDPRLHPKAGGLDARLELQLKIRDTLDKLDRTINEAIAARKSASPKRAAALDAAIDDVVQLHIVASEGLLLHPSALHDHLAYLSADLDLGYQAPTPAQYAVYDELAAQADAGIRKLQAAMQSG